MVIRIVKVVCPYCGGSMRYPTAAITRVFPRCIHCDRPFSADFDLVEVLQ